MNVPTLPPIYAELADALRRRLAVIGDRVAYANDPHGHLQQLQEVSERIVTLQGQLPPPVDPQFSHFLARCSYDKALSWLENAAATV